MPTDINSLIGKLARWIIGLFCGFLIGHDYGTAASIILTHTPEITSAVIGIIATFGPDVWIHLKKSAALLKLRQSFNLPDASPAQIATMAIKAQTVAEMATSKPLAAIKNPAPITPMTGMVIALLIPALFFSGCALMPTVSEQPTTPEQVKISNGLQSVANEIRTAENAFMTPAQFGHDLDALAILLPEIQPYVTAAKLAYGGAWAAGNLSIKAGEGLAARYDS